jgi:hypothetical protein
MNILIDLSRISCPGDLFQEISPLYSICNQDIHIEIKFEYYNELSYLICLVAIIRDIRERENRVLIDCDKNDGYLQRINFFKEMNIDLTESFYRHESTGRFLEISHITKENANDVVKKIINILEKQMTLSPDLSGCLNFCVWEVVDNISVHANSPIGGYVVAQYYPKNNLIEIVIVDTGCGIYASLTKNPRYSILSEENIIKNSIKKEHTSGDGRGNGLYYTVEFIRENEGKFSLFSGNYKICLENGNVYTEKVPYWKGTLVHMKINSDSSPNMRNIFKDEIPTSVEEYSDLF